MPAATLAGDELCVRCSCGRDMSNLGGLSIDISYAAVLRIEKTKKGWGAPDATLSRTCYDDQGDELCIRTDHRMLTSDEQNRSLNAFMQINAMNALGPLVEIHANASHQMHGNPRFLPWHRIYFVGMEESL